MTLGRSRGLAEGCTLGSEQWNEGAGFCTWDRANPDTGPASEVSGWGALNREGSGGAGDSSSAGASSMPWQPGRQMAFWGALNPDADGRACRNGTKLCQGRFRQDVQGKFLYHESGPKGKQASQRGGCHCSRGVYTMPLIRCFNFWLDLKWSDRKVPSD